MTTQAVLRIAFTSYWVAGTGAAGGRHVDAVTYRDRLGLPAMPMTQVKGQLRETAERLANGQLGGWTMERVEAFFGSRPKQAAAGPGSAETRRGRLSFQGEARLPAAVQAALDQDTSGRERLFRRLAATKINADGVAEDKTLRAIEAAVPLVVEGIVAWIGDTPPAADWIGHMDMVCAATLAFGKLKADGYGRAIAECVA